VTEEGKDGLITHRQAADKMWDHTERWVRSAGLLARMADVGEQVVVDGFGVGYRRIADFRGLASPALEILKQPIVTIFGPLSRANH